MKNLKKEEVLQTSHIPDDMKQVFLRAFTKSVYKNEIIEAYHEGKLVKLDLEIAKFLFSYKFATKEQIEQVFPDEAKKVIEGRLQRLMKYRVINSFGLSYNPADGQRLSDDDFTAYCLDLGGQYLLSHFWQDDSVLDWMYIGNVMTSELVAYHLMITDVGIKFLTNKPKGFKQFKPNPELRIGKKTMIPGFELCIENNGELVYFLGDVVRKQDTRTVFREKAEKWNSLLNTKAWMKYYNTGTGQEPVLLIHTTDDEAALSVSGVITDVGEITKFRVTTEERLKGELFQKGTFLRHAEMDGRRQLGLTAIGNFRTE